MKDLDRLKTIQAVIDRELKPGRAAERLGLSVRQIERLVIRYRSEGPVGLISRHRNRPGNRGLKVSVAERIVGILREQYPDFGPTLAAEKLLSRHNIVIAKETVRQLQIAAGLWLPRKLRAPRIQQPRMRRACLGELIQIDGCEHRWFEDRAPACTALVYVDDATSRLMLVKFTGSESTFAYFEATREYIERHGKPLAFYSDKASVFRVNKPDAVKGPGHTQFGRALYELNIDGICANTAAAKGRVERAHLTLQDRLVKELRLEGISNIESANALMPSFTAAYNMRFAKAPRDPHDAHRELRPDEDLNSIFAWRELRKVTKDLTLHYERKLYLLEDKPENRRLIGKYIEVFQFPDGRIEIQAAGRSIPYSIYEKLSTIDQGAIVENKRLGHMLQVAQLVQAHRDNRTVRAPSTAHRADGTRIPKEKLAGTKRQRELSQLDLHTALSTHMSSINAPGLGASAAPVGRQTAMLSSTVNTKKRAKAKAA
ncbi:MAG: ISNCY family transposase [Proteobacteria bacterium]|nr:ISNCY family transposase [Pseudomonadota bacterium]